MPFLLYLFLVTGVVVAASPSTDQVALGNAELERGNTDAAITALERATALDPANSEAQRCLGDAYGTLAQKSGLFTGLRLAKKVRAAYEQAVVLDPHSLAARLSLFDFCLMAPSLLGGGTDKAVAQADVIAQLDADQGHLARSRLRAAEKNYPEARRELAALLAVSPDNYAALYQLGRVAAITGEEVDAGLQALQKCLSLPATTGAPGHDAAQWRLGLLLEKKGNLAAARAAYQASLKLNPTMAEAAESLKRLDHG